MSTFGRVAMLAPMEIELLPLTRELGLVHDGTFHRATMGDTEVLAVVTTMGMTAGEEAARAVLDVGVDRVIVVGIAGGVDPSTVRIGDVVVPETVIDRRDDRRYGPPLSPGATPRGTISCGDELITDPARLATMGNAGVIAVDMETAAVAAVCEAAGVPWSAYRGVSDYAGEGLVDQELFESTNPDGTANADAMRAYLERHPDKLEVLTRLAEDTTRATEAAAATAIRSCVSPQRG
jgi:adenosylhomocysteine nucleosidase